jgi:two-component system cell cycle sensor histidine kinase/response regulator CckA
MIAKRQPKKHSEITVLLAEDEAPLRTLLQNILEKNGLNVLVAEDGQEALRIANEYRGTIHLLVSNVQMPHMTGPDLAKVLKQSRPELRVLLMSGYPQGLLVLDKSWDFLKKPFLAEAIIDKVQQMLAVSPEAQAHEDDVQR